METCSHPLQLLPCEVSAGIACFRLPIPTARLDGWRECFQAKLWWQVVSDLGMDLDFYAQRYRPTTEVLPWDHVNVKKGREYLEKEQKRSLMQLGVMATAE